MINSSKIGKNNPLDILRTFIALVFVFAGFFRILFFQSAVQEFNSMGIPLFFLFFTIIVEVGAGIMLLLNKQIVATVATLCAFLLIALTISIMKAGKSLFVNAAELFSLSPTPEDIFLHITFLIILVVLLMHSLKKK